MGSHDKVFRRLMKENGVAEALLRERLPTELVARFAGPPELLSESFVDAALRDHVADLVLRVQLKGERASEGPMGEEAGSLLVYCVVEHKRTEEAFALVQVLRYLTALYAQLAKTSRRSLPAVVPLIIYNGELPWTGPRRFSQLLDASKNVKRITVDFEVVLLDVGREPAGALSSHPTLRGGLLGLKAAATPAARLQPVISQMLAALAHDESTLRLFLHYLMSVAGRDALPFVERAAKQQRDGKETTMQTISEFLESRGYRRGKRQGHRQGLEQGLELGREEGREAGLRDAIRRVLMRRFKRVTLAAEQKLEGADAATLDRLHDQALSAKSLKAFLSAH